MDRNGYRNSFIDFRWIVYICISSVHALCGRASTGPVCCKWNNIWFHPCIYRSGSIVFTIVWKTYTKKSKNQYLCMRFKIEECLKWGKLATFIPNKNLPIYNWFYFKEGFSRELVLELLRMFNIQRNQIILDPFCGVGTTLLACQEFGVKSIGFDVHPVSVFTSRVKTELYDISELKKWEKEIFSWKFEKPDTSSQPPLIKKAFKKETLEDAIFFRNRLLFIPSEKIRNFFLLGLMNATMKASYVYKDGAVIKIRKKPVPPLRKFFHRIIRKMIKDLERVERKEEAWVEFGDARRLKIENNSIHAVITSPPYLNKIEYSKVYEIEQKLFLDFFQEKPPLRSYLGQNPEKLTQDFLELSKVFSLQELSALPLEAKPYLMDMLQVLQELYRVCKPEANLGIVIGNACFPNKVVDVDILISKIAESLGFRVKKILVLNKRWCTRNRVEKIGITRESLILIRKP